MLARVFDRSMELGGRFKATRFCTDPERPSEVVGEGGCPWADSVHPGNLRIEKQIIDTAGLRDRLSSPAESYLQHIQISSCYG